MTNKNFARLVGHVFGDGYLHKNKKYFIYTNSNKHLHKLVQKLVQKEFGNVKFNEGTSIAGVKRIQYANKVGKKLSELGAPVGSKVLQEIEIPIWILNGSEEVKSQFLGALYDDEGYFRFDRKARQIVFKCAKEIKLKNNLVRYLSQIKLLLKDFEIESSEIKRDQIKKRVDGKEMVSLRFWITKNENFQKFKNKISIFHPNKISSLDKMISAG